MNRRLEARVTELERTRELADLVSHPMPSRDGSATEKLRETLRAHGFEQREEESLAGTFARALGITAQELKARLWEGAYGRSQKVELTR